MSRRGATWSAWAVCGLVLAMGVCAIGLSVPNRYAFGNMYFLIAEASAAVIGGLIAARQPRNPVGWLILGHAFCFTLGEFGRQYAIYGIQTNPGSLLAPALAIWPTYWIWYPGIVLIIVLLPLYFPNGRLLSFRWKWAVWLAVFCTSVATVLAMFRPSEDEAPGIPNPLGFEAFSEGLKIVTLVFRILAPASWTLLGVIAVASLIIRFQRSRGEERQQMKWVVFAVVAVVAFFATSTLTQTLITFPPLVGDLILVGTLGSLQVAIAVAIFRYRLYDIDVIINRALVYGVLTIFLGLVYVGCVVSLQYVFRALTGNNSQLVIVASTLAIAALFNPLRYRVQAFVDRRFYRRKYDAAETLREFSVRLRNETDLDSLNNDLVAVVGKTMQPKHVTLWLRDMR